DCSDKLFLNWLGRGGFFPLLQVGWLSLSGLTILFKWVLFCQVLPPRLALFVIPPRLPLDSKREFILQGPPSLKLPLITFAAWTTLEAFYCLVKTPHPPGGNNASLLHSTSLFDAVRRRQVIEERQGRHPDDTIVTVIEDGKQAIYWDSQEHNAAKRQWRVR